MSDIVIRVENLSKKYTIRHGNGRANGEGLRHAIHNAVTAPLRALRGSIRHQKSEIRNQTSDVRPQNSSLPPTSDLRPQTSSSSEDFFALKDVSFDVRRGEVLGIIGRNGAGKSTLLKILSRITEPTSGRIGLKGRVASLLEVGTGFHPELTGRENIYLNGAILGMAQAEVKKKFDEIVAFAEVEKFLDTPVKHYSSGMYVRLAFAVAAHLESDILIVDEVLAVGDSSFQQKCLGKIGTVARNGRTVLLVSHTMTVVSTLCTRALLLKAGALETDGSTEEVLDIYIRSNSISTGEITWDCSHREANGGWLRLVAARIIAGNKITTDTEIDQPVIIQYNFEVLEDDLNVSSSIHLYYKASTWVLATGTQSRKLNRGFYQHSCIIPANFLNDGTYTVSIILILDSTRLQVHVREAISFSVHETALRQEYLGGVGGCVRPQLNWQEKALTIAQMRPS